MTAPLTLVTATDQASTGLEAGVSTDEHQSLRLWLRLLACSTEIETTIRQRLRLEFGMTLPRFDYLAQLHRHPDGMRMNELTRNLMVTGGNVTGLTDELEKAGFVARIAQPTDRRATLIALTPQGKARFETMAAEHEKWVVQLFGGMPEDQRSQLYRLLGQLRQQMSPEAETPPL
jgi:DNA-binding MarR family transcriptional regulator